MVSNRRLLVKAIVITTVVFLLGLFVGTQLDTVRTNTAFETLRQSELDMQSYLAEQDFYQAFGSYRCELAQPQLTRLSERLGELGYNLVTYEERSTFSKEDYTYLLRKYFLEEIRAYTLFTQLKERCHLNTTLILYFFDPQDSLSERQGRALDVLVKKRDGISVFSINFQYTGDSLVDGLKLYYNVTRTPTLIINSNVTLDTFVPLDELETYLS